MPRVYLDVESWMFDVGCSVFVFSAPPRPRRLCRELSSTRQNPPKPATTCPNLPQPATPPLCKTNPRVNLSHPNPALLVLLRALRAIAAPPPFPPQNCAKFPNEPTAPVTPAHRHPQHKRLHPHQPT